MLPPRKTKLQRFRESTMGILKLPNVGDEATLTIAECEVVDGAVGKQVKFVDVGGDILFLPQASADRQLDRIGLLLTEEEGGDEEPYAVVPGNVLRFSRSPNAKKGLKPYWNIDRGEKTNGKPPISEVQNVGRLPNDPPEGATEIVDVKDPKEEAAELRLYRKCVSWYLSQIVPMLDKADIGTTPESVTAGIATLFISLKARL
jgi:hypothetical protein